MIDFLIFLAIIAILPIALVGLILVVTIVTGLIRGFFISLKKFLGGFRE